MSTAPSPSRAAFDRDGFAGPFPLANPQGARKVLALYPTLAGPMNQHVLRTEVVELLGDPELVRIVHSLCGEGLSIWRTAFFAKTEGAGEIGWHHDKHFQAVEDDEVSFDEIDNHFSVFVAMTDVDGSNGRIEVIPSSHVSDARFPRDRRPYHLRPPEDHFIQHIPADLSASRRGIDIPAGSFLVFHSALLHRSLPHQGGPPRLAIAMRLVRDGVAPPADLADPGDIIPFGGHRAGPA